MSSWRVVINKSYHDEEAHGRDGLVVDVANAFPAVLFRILIQHLLSVV